LIKNKVELICTPNNLIPAVTVSYFTFLLSAKCAVYVYLRVAYALCEIRNTRTSTYFELPALQIIKRSASASNAALHLIATSVHSRSHNWLYE